MSRIIVKNLPKKITAKKLEELFSTKGCITDLQLKYTKDGKFRQFAFVGYKTDEEARAAMEYFHGTFVNASKIQVEVCTNLGDTNKPRAWSKHSKEKKISETKLIESSPTDENEMQKEKKKKKKKDRDDKESQEFPKELLKDTKFKEFLEVNKVRSTKPMWGDDGVNLESKDDEKNDGAEENESSSDEELEESLNLAKNKAVSDKEYFKSKIISSSEVGSKNLEAKTENKEKSNEKKEKILDDTFTVKLRNLPYNCKKREIKKFFHPLKIESLRIPPKIKGIAFVKFGSEKEMKQALNKHKSFLEGHKIDVVKHEKKNNNNESENPEDDAAKKKEEQEMLAESGRIFIRNLCFDATEDELEKLFSKYGPLTEIHLPIDPYTKKSLCFGFVSFLFAEHAVKAFAELDGTIFQGRLLHLIPSKPKKETTLDVDNLSYKQKKAAKLKALGGNSYNWNTLFLGLNAVADAISKHYNIEKSTLLNEEGDESLAVRMALGETQLVMETREFLIKNNVQLDSFSQAAAERSKTVIIAKNLPANTPSTEIYDLFSKYGIITRVVLPPSGITALIEFQEPVEAKTAFRKLCYSRFGSTPLYLEWAPMNVFKEDAAPPDTGEKKQANEASDNTKMDDQEAADEDEPVPQVGTTLFVKNLNFETTEKDIERHFKNYGPLYAVSISKKKDLHSGNLLSMGFGFVQFRQKSSATRALQDLQHSELHGHKLELKFSNKATLVKPETSRKIAKAQEQKTSKILVRNIPFEVTEKEVRDLFKEFGNLKTVRLPKKATGEGSHRGFGFVDFVSKSNAKRAFNTLCHSTHLLGRRLVLEWANPEMDDVSELRKKTAREFYVGGPVKKLTKSKLREDVALASAKRKEQHSE